MRIQSFVLKMRTHRACTDTEVLLKQSQIWTVDSGYMHLLQTGAWNNFENKNILFKVFREDLQVLNHWLWIFTSTNHNALEQA